MMEENMNIKNEFESLGTEEKIDVVVSLIESLLFENLEKIPTNENTSKNEIRYRTMKILDPHQDYLIGSVVVATQPINDELSKFKAGISFCSPKDNFNKKVGQEKALRRLITNPILFVKNPEVPITEYLKEFIIEESSEIGWMKRAIEQGVTKDNIV